MGALVVLIVLVAVAAGLDHFLLNRPSRDGRRAVAAAEDLTAAAARALLAADNRLTVSQYELTALYEPPDARPGYTP